MTGHKQFERFIKRTYDETFQLLEEAMEYSTHGSGQDTCDLPSTETMKVTSESMRLTSQLSEIMSWLMTHKALFRGEIPLEQATGAYHLSAADVCLREGRRGEKACSGQLVGMLDRSRALYSRVMKMDQMATRLYANNA